MKYVILFSFVFNKTILFISYNDRYKYTFKKLTKLKVLKALKIM